MKINAEVLKKALEQKKQAVREGRDVKLMALYNNILHPKKEEVAQ